MTLSHDPAPWLMDQDGWAAVRGRRLLDLDREGDRQAVQAFVRELAEEQRPDGSFSGSLMKTAGVLSLLSDVGPSSADRMIARGAGYLLSVLESQPGYGTAAAVKPGSLQTPFDLCGFFGPYEDRALPEAVAHGAREMNYYREYEPLTGPKSPVRTAGRSSLHRMGPTSCYSWGLIPLCYTIETLCRAGHAHDVRLQPAINALLGAQRRSGGWCRNLGGHPNCTLHAARAVGAHPELQSSEWAEHALRGMRGRWKGTQAFAAMQAVASFQVPSAREMLSELLASVAPLQRKNGAFGGPCPVERVCAVLLAVRAIA